MDLEEALEGAGDKGEEHDESGRLCCGESVMEFDCSEEAIEASESRRCDARSCDDARMDDEAVIDCGAVGGSQIVTSIGASALISVWVRKRRITYSSFENRVSQYCHEEKMLSVNKKSVIIVCDQQLLTERNSFLPLRCMPNFHNSFSRYQSRSDT